jgi:hypothetical protein
MANMIQRRLGRKPRSCGGDGEDPRGAGGALDFR